MNHEMHESVKNNCQKANKNSFIECGSVFKNIYGLSCVENQVLSLLKERNNDISYLYHNSAIPLKELFFFMVMKGENPYCFYRVPRIQEELKKLEILDMVKKQPRLTRTLRDKIRHLQKNEYVLIRVKSEFTENVLHARGFRDDHFVRVKPFENGFVIQNDIPELSVNVTATGLSKIYDGEYLLITVKKEIEEDTTITTLWKTRLFKAEKYVPFYFKETDLEGIPALADRLCNMIYVYKIMRYRLAEYYGNYVDTKFIQKAMPVIERYHAKAGYYSIRKNTSVQKLFELLYNICYQEVELMNTLKEKLEEKNKNE